MRKLLLSVASFVLLSGQAIYGQDCTPTSNNPAIGVPYSYKVSVSTPYTGNGTYQWYVTQATNLLTGDVIEENNKYFTLETTGVGNSAYNATSGTTNDLSLIWKADALDSAQPFYLVLKYTENNGTCSAMNIKAMKIKPLNTFKLEVLPVSDEDGNPFAGEAKVCSAEISSATIDGDKVKYVYGKNTLYYKVIATGFKGDWKPTITLPALGGNAQNRKYESIQWKQGTGNFVDFKSGFTASGEEQTLVADAKSTILDANSGGSFILKVVIDNGTYEGLQDEVVQLSTEGKMVLSDGSLSNRDIADDCSALSEDRNASQTILARPAIQASSGEFIIQIQ